MAQQAIYTVEQVAARYGVDVLTVRRRIVEGKLKAFRTNGTSGHYRITESALEEFERDSMAEVAAEQGA